MARALLLLLGPALLLQEAPKPADAWWAVRNARILTVTDGEIGKGVVVIKNGKIEAVGVAPPIPDGATIVEGEGLVVMPGLVHGHTRVGGSAGGGGAAHHLAADEFNPATEGFRTLLRSGFTTVVLAPAGGPISGQACAYKPRGVTADQMIFERSCFLRLDMEASTQVKEQIKKAFEGVAKPKAPGPPGAPPAKPDEKTEPLSKLLKGEIRGLVQIASPAEYAHFLQVWKPFEAPAQRIAVLGTADLYRGAELLAARKPKILMRPDVAYLPFTRDRVNGAAELEAAGCPVAFYPVDWGGEVEEYLFRVASLVKLGFPRDAALKAITIRPAEIAGIDGRVGSLKPGKDGDLLLLDGDPFSGTARILKVVVDGRVEFEAKP